MSALRVGTVTYEGGRWYCEVTEHAVGEGGEIDSTIAVYLVARVYAATARTCRERAAAVAEALA